MTILPKGLFPLLTNAAAEIRIQIPAPPIHSVTSLHPHCARRLRPAVSVTRGGARFLKTGAQANRCQTPMWSPPLPRAYHPDGQMRDEVYNYGSFKQSKMFAAGVTCSD